MPLTRRRPCARGRVARLGEAADRVVVGDADDREPGAAPRGRRAPWATAAVGRGRVEVEIDHDALARAAAALARPCVRRRAPLALDERPVLADEQVEVLALLVGELEEDPLAFGVLEPLAVALEEPVRAALAPDADQQRLPIVDAVGSAPRRRRRTGRWPRP